MARKQYPAYGAAFSGFVVKTTITPNLVNMLAGGRGKIHFMINLTCFSIGQMLSGGNKIFTQPEWHTFQYIDKIKYATTN